MKSLEKIRQIIRPKIPRIRPMHAAVSSLMQREASADGSPSMPKLNSTIGLAVFFALLTGSGRGAVTTPAGVDTNPLNLDPLVRQSFQRYYILDYDGALAGFEKVQAQN